MRKISNETPNSLGSFSLLVLTICTVGICVFVGVAAYCLIAAVPVPDMKIDDDFEISLLRLALNFGIPGGLVALVVGIILCFRKALPQLPLVLVALAFVSAAFCSVLVWNALATQFSPHNLWKDCIWW